MNALLERMLKCYEEEILSEFNVIPWSSPVPFFGDISNSKLATVGLNPSNREFLDVAGIELHGGLRRFHTHRSFEIQNWNEINSNHVEILLDGCVNYFNRNPYDIWFKKLNNIISKTKYSYYGDNKACHLDLVPYATYDKWGSLSKLNRKNLLEISRLFFIDMLFESNIEMLVLNGRSVVDEFQKLTQCKLNAQQINVWNLSRSSGSNVPGCMYTGEMKLIISRDLNRTIKVFGFNHNIQSSFGITKEVVHSISQEVEHFYSGR